MEIAKKKITTAKGAKDYLSKNEIPQLFECLMTGLMYNRPENYLEYLQDCLEKIKKQGISAVRWDMFLEAKKTPLPPIGPSPKEDFRPEPLPEIGQYKLNLSLNANFFVLISGPGMNKAEIGNTISFSQPDIHRVSMGNLLRARAAVEKQNLDSKWMNVASLMDSGGLAPAEFAMETLLEDLNKNSKKENFFIEGYPRTLEEKNDFERVIGSGRLRSVIIVDSEEGVCNSRLLNRMPLENWNDGQTDAVNKRIKLYKSETLPMCKYFDDLGKLKVLDGDTDSKVYSREIVRILDSEMKTEEESCVEFSQDTTNSPRSPKSQRSRISPRSPKSPGSAASLNSKTPEPIHKSVTEIAELVGIPREVDRDEVFPHDIRIVLLLGGPGAGKTEIAEHICQRHSDILHVDLNKVLREKVINSESPDNTLVDSVLEENSILTESLKWNVSSLKQLLLDSISDSHKTIFLEGFPRSKEELEELNVELGQVDVVILLDSEESEMRTRLEEKFSRLGHVEDNEENVEKRIQYFKLNGLSICRYYDERSRLNIVNADQDVMVVMNEIFSILQQKQEMMENNSAAEEAEEGTEITDREVTKEDKENEEENENNENAVDDNKSQFLSGEEDNVEKTITPARSHPELANCETQDDEVIVDEETEKSKDVIEDNNIEIEAQNVDIIKDEIENLDVELGEAEGKVEGEVEGEEVEEEVIEPKTELLLGSRGVRTMSQLGARDMNVILILGGPGSGKKMVGDHIVAKFAYPFIHTDQLIRSEIEAENQNSEKLKVFLEDIEGDFDVLMKLIRRELMKAQETCKTVVVAGFPKTTKQYQVFCNDITDPVSIIHLDAATETLKSRLEVEDDSDLNMVVSKRLEMFTSHFPAFLNNIDSDDKYKKVDADREINDVVADVENILNELNDYNAVRDATDDNVADTILSKEEEEKEEVEVGVEMEVEVDTPAEGDIDNDIKVEADIELDENVEVEAKIEIEESAEAEAEADAPDEEKEANPVE